MNVPCQTDLLLQAAMHDGTCGRCVKPSDRKVPRSELILAMAGGLALANLRIEIGTSLDFVAAPSMIIVH